MIRKKEENHKNEISRKEKITINHNSVCKQEEQHLAGDVKNSSIHKVGVHVLVWNLNLCLCEDVNHEDEEDS